MKLHVQQQILRGEGGNILLFFSLVKGTTFYGGTKIKFEEKNKIGLKFLKTKKPGHGP